MPSGFPEANFGTSASLLAFPYLTVFSPIQHLLEVFCGMYPSKISFMDIIWWLSRYPSQVGRRWQQPGGWLLKWQQGRSCRCQPIQVSSAARFSSIPCCLCSSAGLLRDPCFALRALAACAARGSRLHSGARPHQKRFSVSAFLRSWCSLHLQYAQGRWPVANMRLVGGLIGIHHPSLPCEAPPCLWMRILMWNGFPSRISCAPCLASHAIGPGSMDPGEDVAGRWSYGHT